MSENATPVALVAEKQRKGFRAMPRRVAHAIHAAGGRATAARYGSDYMRALGAKGGARPKRRAVETPTQSANLSQR